MIIFFFNFVLATFSKTSASEVQTCLKEKNTRWVTNLQVWQNDRLHKQIQRQNSGSLQCLRKSTATEETFQ